MSRSIEPGLGSDEAQEAVREGEHRYRHLFNQLNDAVFVADVETGVIIEANQQAEVLLGKGLDEITSMHQSELHPPDKAEQYRAMFASHIEKGHAADFDAQVVRKDGTIVPVSISASTLTLHGKRLVVGLFRDMTEPKRVEAALAASATQWQNTFDAIEDLVVIIDKNFRVLRANQAVANAFPDTEVQGVHCYELFHGLDSPLPSCASCQAFQTQEPAHAEICEPHLDYHWFDCYSYPIPDIDGGVEQVVHVIRDITERKEGERQLRIYQQRLRALATRLSSVEEQERRAIAAGLHDDISQTLALCKMRMASLDESSPPSDVASTSGEVRGLLDQAINRTRSLTFQLSPPVLYELGFVAAVEWLAEQLEEEHGVVFSIQQDSQPSPIDDEISIVLFRAVRELLINVIKHAQTNTAKVSIERDDDQVQVVVQDEGVGFDAAQLGPHGRPPGFGLFDIRERLSYVGGVLKVESQPGAGTRVAMIVPLKLQEQAATDKEQ